MESQILVIFSRLCVCVVSEHGRDNAFWMGRMEERKKEHAHLREMHADI